MNTRCEGSFLAAVEAGLKGNVEITAFLKW